MFLDEFEASASCWATMAKAFLKCHSGGAGLALHGSELHRRGYGTGAACIPQRGATRLRLARYGSPDAVALSPVAKVPGEDAQITGELRGPAAALKQRDGVALELLVIRALYGCWGVHVDRKSVG